MSNDTLGYIVHDNCARADYSPGAYPYPIDDCRADPYPGRAAHHDVSC
jgi:hypothetical protein